MMEVKQNTAVDLNDLLGPTKSVSDGTDELDDAIMTDLSENTGPQEVHCNLIKSNDNSNNGLVVAATNGDDTLSSLMDMEPSETTCLDDVTVSTELEEALLAEDDVLPNVATVKDQSAVAPTVAVEDILADKVETSNSTTSSNNVRDPGDDLDTLLSKINDIVDDCLDNEVVGSGPVAVVPCAEEDVATEKQEPTECTSPAVVNTENLDESVMIVDDPTDEENNVEKDATLPVAEEVKEKESITTEIMADLAVEVKIDELRDAKEKETETEEQSSAIEAENEVTAEAVENEDKQPQETGEASVECEKTEEQVPTEKIEDALNLDQETKKDECRSQDDKEAEEAVPKESTCEEKNETAKAEEDLLVNNKDDEQCLDDLGEEKNTVETSEDKQVLEASDSQDCNVDETADTSDIVKENPTNEEDLESTQDMGNKKEDDKTETEDKQDDKNEKVDNTEDSDDDIVFYVDDKPTESGDEKSKDKEDKECSSATNKTSTEKSEEKEKPSAADDDTVVILDDDDEVNEEADKKPTEEKKSENTDEKSQSQSDKTGLIEKSPSKETKEMTKESLDMDNSDNARDEFVTDKTANASTTGGSKSQEVEETNSNCSSSSNLLLEAKTTENSGDGPTQEENENENEEEDDDGDVELIENESKEAENSSEKGEELTPPAKRQRLSEDDSQVSMNIDETSNKSQTITESSEKKAESLSESASVTVSTSTATTTSLKRSHDVIELELDDKSNDSKASIESSTKKPRTEASSQEEAAAVASITDTPSEVTIPKEEVDDTKEDVKDIKKMIPSYKPIPLYPPPKMETLKSEKTFSLDFLKKFRKSFDKMTKQDLEEMVLQKVVEAIIHKSEFAEMRELLEKQEKLISSHRTKITELSKQFRDLEMVHNRVVKDIDQRNSQFIMPVKITRAVGLQVYIPNKKSVLDTSSNSSTTASNIPASSPQRQAVPHGSLTSPQRPILPTQSSESQTRPGSNLSSAVNAAITNAVRRGCAQKVTPTRPMPSSNMTSSSATGGAANTSSVYRSNLSQGQAPPQPRILNKNASTATASSNTNAAGVQRNRYMPSNMDPMRMQQQQQQQQAAASRPTANNQRIVTQPKPSPSASTAPRRPDSAASASSNNSTALDSYMNTLSQLTGGNTAVSITPAKPKEKAVIDLTDEDEMPAATPASNAQPANNGPAANQGPQQRRSLPTQNNTNSSAQYGRNAPPLARIPPISNLMANSNKNRQTAAQGQKSNNSSFASTISTPPGTSITRINVAASTQNAQRVKYSHPAPLPATPPQAFNPAWKLPPPRPTIRISNLDNGIVISWTMEESMDRHAECVSYQIYAYQETSGPPMADSWRHVGDVKAMLLPMAVTLTQFQEGQRYFFAVRAVDCHQRYGPFSLPKTWS